MIHKKALWLGVIASLAITPFLVAQLAPPTVPSSAPVASVARESAAAAPLEGLAAAPAPVRGVAESVLPAAAPIAPPVPLVPPLPAEFGAPNLNLATANAGAERPTGAVMPAAVAPAPVAGAAPAQQDKEQPPKEKKQLPKVPTVLQPETPPAPAPAAPAGTGRPSLGIDASKIPDPFEPAQRGVISNSVNRGQVEAAPPTNVADLLGKANSAQGVEIQRRSPLVGDPRIEGLHFGQIVTSADGAYWFPARVDLDTIVSKLNSDNINSIQIIKGPFSVRYGPGFSFLDIGSRPTYRSGGDYFDAHGSSSGTYRTNGLGWQGNQNIWGGNKDWGFNLNYSAQTAGDYVSGNGTKLPSSFNNQFVDFSLGIDLSRDSKLEARYMHVQQSNVLIPGLVTDINELVSDGFTARYISTNGGFYDRLAIDTWVNNTNFNGDSNNPQTRAQVPQLNQLLVVPGANFLPVRLDITTNGHALSYGARETATWGDVQGFNISAGSDVRVFANNYNEFDSFNFSVANFGGQATNLGIPSTRFIDPGIFADAAIPWGESLVMKVGSRVDFVTNQFLGFGPSVSNQFNTAANAIGSYNTNVGTPYGDKSFFLFSGFATAEYKINPEWTATAGYGYAQRPPTLTELYAGGALLGLIQNGLNAFYGNTNLRKEEMHQLSASLNGNYEDFRISGNAFYAWMPNYITYTNEGLFGANQPLIIGGVPVVAQQNFGAGQAIQTLRFKNTNLGTMYGFEARAEYDALAWLTPFGNLSYVEAWDQTQHIALPGIPPLASRLGLRFHPPGADQKWNLEYYARIVATQAQAAYNLGEQRTGGFTTHHIRGFWEARKNLLLMAGVDNFGNLQYREHLDLRTGAGVFQPGINFYFGMKLTY